jgi:hypothetical protein
MMIRRVVLSMVVSWLNQTEQLNPPWKISCAPRPANEYEPYLASQRPRTSCCSRLERTGCLLVPRFGKYLRAEIADASLRGHPQVVLGQRDKSSREIGVQRLLEV